MGTPLGVFLHDHPSPPAEERRASDPGIFNPFYADEAAFDGLTRRSAQMMKLLLAQGVDWG